MVYILRFSVIKISKKRNPTSKISIENESLSIYNEHKYATGFVAIIA